MWGHCRALAGGPKTATSPYGGPASRMYGMPPAGRASGRILGDVTLGRGREIPEKTEGGIESNGWRTARCTPHFRKMLACQAWPSLAKASGFRIRLDSRVGA